MTIKTPEISRPHKNILQYLKKKQISRLDTNLLRSVGLPCQPVWGSLFLASPCRRPGYISAQYYLHNFCKDMEIICGTTTDLHAGCGGGEGLDCGAVTHLPYHNITVSTQCLLSTHRYLHIDIYNYLHNLPLWPPTPPVLHSVRLPAATRRSQLPGLGSEARTAVWRYTVDSRGVMI